MKFATFIDAPVGENRSDFQAWCVENYIPTLVSASPTLRGCVWRLVRDSPGTPMDDMFPVLDQDFFSFAVLIETWFSAVEDFRREILPVEQVLIDRSARHMSYRVTPRLQKDPRTSEAGQHGRRPEITSVASVTWSDKVTAAHGSECWNRHAAIALRQMKTITKYEQNVVEEVISFTQGVTAIDGFADFSFDTIADCQTGYISSHEELQDVASYVSGGRFVYLGDVTPAGR